jgi:DNA processing protein
MSRVSERFELSRTDALFPEHLKQFDWCPAILYGRGDPTLLKRGIGIIGARKASPYGISAARQVAQWCAQIGLPVYSGAAIGCDQAAHVGALDADGDTIAVLGCGADIVYPRGATKLFESMVSHGCVISTFGWGTPPQRYTFIERNRLIVALSHLLVVVEGRMPSGTFSAVNWATQLNVDVAAVPGSIFSAESSGPHHLLSNGAVPLYSKENLVDALTLTIEYGDEPIGSIAHATLSKDERAMLELLQPMPLSIDEIARISEVATVTAVVTVNLLEMKGFIARLADGRVMAVA